MTTSCAKGFALPELLGMLAFGALLFIVAASIPGHMGTKELAKAAEFLLVQRVVLLALVFATLLLAYWGGGKLVLRMRLKRKEAQLKRDLLRIQEEWLREHPQLPRPADIQF
jgi:hypothetical protein